jgi:hypothetical protein
MSDIFPKWTNRLPLLIAAGALLIGGTTVAGLWYYSTPKYTRVGYKPVQPVPFSHDIHVNQLGMDCRYCHSDVEKSWYANVPSTSTCMNCHNQILKDDARLSLVQHSHETGEPIPWVQVHKVPDFVYFNHAVHVNRGVSCYECHGQVNRMEEVFHAQPLSMAFCLDCHRNPEQRLRRPEDVFDLDYRLEQEEQIRLGTQFVHDWKINASQNCSACHR